MSKSTLAVETLVLESGERLPLLVSRDTGVPLYDSTAFVLQTARARGRASSTIDQALRSLARLLRFLPKHGIDLTFRFKDGKVLTLGEVEALARACQLSTESMEGEGPAVGDSVKGIPRIFRMRKKAPPALN